MWLFAGHAAESAKYAKIIRQAGVKLD